MKINMWKLLIAGLFASAALAGCEDNRNNFMVDDTLSFVNEEQYAGVSVYNGKYEFAILKNGKGQQSAKALLSVSETALAEYNAANGTNYAVLPVGRRLVYATHGHVHNLKNLPPLAPGDVLLHGHTHIPAWTEFGEGNLYLNPGSVSIPKEGSAHSYMTLEGETFLWKTLEGEVYRELEL